MSSVQAPGLTSAAASTKLRITPVWSASGRIGIGIGIEPTVRVFDTDPDSDTDKQPDEDADALKCTNQGLILYQQGTVTWKTRKCPP